MEEEFIEPVDKPLPKPQKNSKKRGPNNSDKSRTKNQKKGKKRQSSESPIPEFIWNQVNVDYEAKCHDPRFANEGDVFIWDANEFTYENIRRTGLKNPILFTNQQDILGIKIPDVSYEDVVNLIQPFTKIDVFDHSTEKTKNMLVKTVAEEMVKPADNRLGPLNMLSLEVSYHKLGELVEPPRLVRELDWAKYIFPKEFEHRQYSKVEKYAIFTMARSYTDFHIDFAGTSVWYHVKKGLKYFFLIEPSLENLQIFEEHKNAYHSGVHVGFFGDVITGKCTCIKLTAGQTLILPSGWIHAVYTPEDSLVFGGNFLHSFSIPTQIEVRGQETRGQVQKKFTYYCYDQTLWYYAAHVVERALGKKYVRLIKRSEYDSILIRLAEHPEEFANCCYDIQLNKDEFYDDPRPEGPIQFTFDACNENVIRPPSKFNEEYLSQITPFEIVGLIKLVQVLGDYRDLLLNRRQCKVPEGIRRPKHLLQDFRYVVDYITNTAFTRRQPDVNTNSLNNKSSIVESNSPKNVEEVKNDDNRDQVEAKTQNIEAKIETEQTTEPTGSNGTTDGVQIKSEESKKEMNGQIEVENKEEKPVQSIESQGSSQHQDIGNVDVGSPSKRKRKNTNRSDDDPDFEPQGSMSKHIRKHSPSFNGDHSTDLLEPSEKKKSKKSPKAKATKNNNDGNAAKGSAPVHDKKPASHTQPPRRRRSYLKTGHKHGSKDEEDHAAKNPPKHRIDAPSPDAAPPVDVVPLGSKFNHQHVGSIKRLNAHITPVAIHGARLGTKEEKHRALESIKIPGQMSRPSTSPKVLSDQKDLFNEMFISPVGEKRRSFSKPSPSPTASTSNSFERPLTLNPVPSPTRHHSKGEEVPYTPTRPSLNLSSLHSPLSPNNPYNSSFNRTLGGYDPRNADMTFYKTREHVSGETFSPGIAYQPPPSQPSPSQAQNRKNLKYQHALDQLDDINSILGRDD
ncbi:unnamed protein product [Bursaphelenchus xylophilus]|uniref:(pine wood nematode) hypothetical protein n=1 Tax=Bursaphelenchus xylophilus TaxID=6326 RepID=A0A811KZ99_BURXY|nr:unnamed protein product [Bursaphelenchus xylophilus]CAG9109096.1 unnamed protein product [Bursaphelenchus xylophilus]